MTQVSPPPLSQMTRDELYTHLRSTTKDALVLQEMRRLGFWPATSELPTQTEELITREAELTKTLNELSDQLQRVQDPKAALRDMRKQRMAAAKERREQTRQRAAQWRFEKVQAWQQRRQKEILYLGEGVSSGLNYTAADPDKLARYDLPRLQNAAELATAIGIQLAELRFMSFQRKVSRVRHYQRFAIAKKTGGQRIISAPMPRLKRCQYWILDHILAKVPCHAAAHGFLPQHSILSNALPHVGQAVVINLDLKNFFPSISYQRVKGVFKTLGYGEQLATVLGLLCTEQASDEVRIDTQTYFVAGKERNLPQGAPSSPMITNILCHTLDKRLAAAAQKLGFTYTRYADDLTFSTDQKERPPVGKLLWRVKKIIESEGFTPHPDKQRIMRYSQKQEVTGIVVNQTPTIAAKTLHRFRATLHQVEKNGTAGAHWNGNTNVLSALEGYARYVCMVNPAKGQPWLARVKALRARRDPASDQATVSQQFTFNLRQQVGAGLTPQRKNGEQWWQVSEPAAPVLEQTALQIAAAKVAANEARKKADKKDPGKAKQQAQSARKGTETAAPEELGVQDSANNWRPVPWWVLGVQLYLALHTAYRFHSVVPLALFLPILAYSAISRRNLSFWIFLAWVFCLIVL